MPTSWNIALQATVLVTAALLRINTPGWILILLVGSVVGLVLTCVPLVTALVVRGRGRLGSTTAVPFVVAAVSLLVAAAFLAEADDRHDYVPILALVAGDAVRPPGMTFHFALGDGAVLVYLCSLVWLLDALVATSRRGGLDRGAPGPAEGRAR